MSTLITTGQLTLYDYNDALIAGTPPSNPQVDTLWLDTSTSPNMMKRWNGAKWDNIGELDPQYTEKIETITGNITEIEKTLGNMADDGKLDLTDRQDLVDKLIPIIGYIPSSADTTLKTAAELDSLKKGSFAKIRESAVDAGILTTNTAYTGLATAWTNLRAYLNGLSPKPWDIGTANEKNDSVVVKATFRTHWLNYYNAEYVLATATSKNLNTAITVINNTTIPALQNASLSNSEKAAINQSLLVLTSEKTGMNGEVLALKSNPKFLSQTALDGAKSNYDAAYSSVSSSIAAVMAIPTGTLIPSTLIRAVETAIIQYGEKLSALQREIQNAQTAISNKISADASAELSSSLLEYVDKTSYGQDIAAIQNQVDGAITTWFGNNEPTLLTAPAKDWNTTELKDVHLGDLYYDNISGYGYRFGKDGTLYRWIRIVDADVVAALAAAQNAQDTADGKRRAFYNQPTPPYDIGDLWVQGASGELMRAIVTKAKGGLYHESDWVKATKYTDDTVAKEAVTSASNAQSAANKAQEDATKANNAVSDIISDNKMTPDEKVILQREWLNIQYERNEILSQAERYVIDSASYRSAYDTLSGYLSPFFTNLTTTQDVNGETLRSNFQRYYEQRQAILDAISVAAQQKVLDLQTQVDAGPFADKTEILSGTEIFTDKADDSVVHIEIDGKSVGGGSGKNLLYPINLNTEFTYIGGLKPNTEYTMSTNTPLKGEHNLYFSTWGIGVDDEDGGGYYTARTDENGATWYQIFPDRPYTEDLINQKYWIQLEEGSAATQYEPPAPTPDYPIEIHSLNDFDVVSSSSKGNLLNNGDFSSGLHKWANENLSVFEVNDKTLKVRTPSVDARFYYDIVKMPVGSRYILSYSIMSPQGGVMRVGQGGTFIDQEFTAKPTWQRVNIPITSGHATYTLSFYPQNTNVDFYIKDIILLEDTTENSYLHKTNILLSEPLRSVGDVKDRLFRDTDGLWKVERNVVERVFEGTESFLWATAPYIPTPLSKSKRTKVECSHLVYSSSQSTTKGKVSWGGSPDSNKNMFFGKDTWPDLNTFKSWTAEQFQVGTPLTVQYELESPIIEILPQADQDKLNNIASYKDSNYVYTIVDKINILPIYVRDNLKPNLRATFKSQAWYQNYKRGDDLRHFVEAKGLDRAIRFGMLVDYQSFAMPTSNWLYFCKIQTNTDDFREELVDENGSIFDYTTQREIKVPKQALDLRGVAEGTVGYLAFDTRNQLMWFIHYQRNYTYTTNQETGIIEKIPSSEYWIKWNPGKAGHNTQLVLDESVYIVGEIER